MKRSLLYWFVKAEAPLILDFRLCIATTFCKARFFVHLPRSPNASPFSMDSVCVRLEMHAVRGLTSLGLSNSNLDQLHTIRLRSESFELSEYTCLQLHLIQIFLQWTLLRFSFLQKLSCFLVFGTVSNPNDEYI